MSTHTFTADDDLDDLLDDEGNKSEAIRDALRLYYDLDDRHGLSGVQARIYEALLDYTGDGERRVRVTELKKAIPQYVNVLDQTMVVSAGLRPLDRKGYIDVSSSLSWVAVDVNPPELVDRPTEDAPPEGDGGEPNEDALDEAERADAILNGDYEVEGVGSA